MVMNAQTFEVDGINYKVTGENTVEVTYNDTKYSGDVKIPATVTSENGIKYSVTSIGERVFQGCCFYIQGY